MALLESVLAVSIAATCSAPSLGAEVTNISHRIRRERQIPSFVTGALVGPVWNGGPAARAGFESGDVIQGVGDELVQNVCEFERALSRQRCGEVRFAVRRGTRNLEITAALADAGRLRRPKRSDAAACRDGDGAACRNLAGRDDAVDHFLRQGCDLGDGESCYRLALAIGVDRAPAVPFYEQACDAGIARACTNLGWMYERGRGVTKDPGEALRLHRLGCNATACGAPNNLGCVNLGRFHRDGIGVAEDHLEAARLFRMVCERRPADGEDAETIARACSLAGTEMVFGKERKVLGDPARGREYLEKGCAANDVFGCFNLGVLHEFGGEGVTIDRSRAAAYYRRACDRGDSEACERLVPLVRR